MNEVIFAVVGLAVLTVVVEAISRFVGKSIFWRPLVSVVEEEARISSAV